MNYIKNILLYSFIVFKAETGYTGIQITPNTFKPIISDFQNLNSQNSCQASSYEKIWSTLNWQPKYISNICRDKIPGISFEEEAYSSVENGSNILDQSIKVTNRDALISFLEKNISDENKSEKKDADLGDFNFKDESPVLIELFKKLVTNKETKAIEIKNKTNCTKVLCAIKEIYSDDNLKSKGYTLTGDAELAGLLSLYALKNFGFNTSAYSGFTVHIDPKDQFNVAELFRIIEEIGWIPPQVRSTITDHPFQLSKWESATNGAAANASIQLFTGVKDEFKNYMIRGTISHEVAHVLCKGIDLSQEWLDVSDWKQNKEKSKDNLSVFCEGCWKASNEEMFLSQFSLTNPAEDCAEHVYAYTRYPLNQKIPVAKFNFIKEKIFKGFVFDGLKDCR